MACALRMRGSSPERGGFKIPCDTQSVHTERTKTAVSSYFQQVPATTRIYAQGHNPFNGSRARTYCTTKPAQRIQNPPRATRGFSIPCSAPKGNKFRTCCHLTIRPTCCGFYLAPPSKIGVHGRLDKTVTLALPPPTWVPQNQPYQRSESNDGLHPDVRDDGYNRDHLFSQVTRKAPGGVRTSKGGRLLAGHGRTMTLGHADIKYLNLQFVELNDLRALKQHSD